MGIFERFFGAAKIVPVVTAPPPKVAVAVPTAPGTTIGYDARLIQGFVSDHRVLLKTWTDIHASAKAGDLRQVEKGLEAFRKMLMDHLLRENVRLYVYLEHLLKGDLTSHSLIHEFRGEMDGIGRVVVGFLNTYKGISAQPALTNALLTDMESIGAALVDRIQREEATLYPLYLPST